MTLSPKQQAALAKAPPARKAALRAMYERQQSQKKKAPPQLKSAPARKTMPVPKPLSFAFDGFDKRHLPLDELTAPYTTTNFVGVLEFSTTPTMDQVVVVCPRAYKADGQTGPGGLTDYIAMVYDANETIDGAIPVLDYLRAPIIDIPTIDASVQHTSVRARLHNLSVRLECLGTNTGLYPPGSAYIGTVPMIETGNGSTGQVEALSIRQAWADDSIAVGYLKSVPAASLVQRPITIHSAVAETVSYKTWRDMFVPSTAADKGSLAFVSSLEPIVVYVPRTGAGTTSVQYRLVVGQQWCSRHPHNVMLRSTAKQHPATAPGIWHQALGAVKDVGEKLMQRAGDTAIDLLTSRMRQSFSPALAIGDAPLLVD